jgi:hypothetical protein
VPPNVADPYGKIETNREHKLAENGQKSRKTVGFRTLEEG